jgi:poly-gamma-glutamate capsule biosynthesis protein CapA/YwtB (metallophosphatase superfamily)
MGDVMLGRGVAQAHSGDEWATTLAALLPVTSQADLTAANLESPLTDEAPISPGGFDLRAPAESARALGGAGVSLVTLANNHALDAGQPGLRQTLAVLRNAGIRAAGPDPSPQFITIRGQRVAIIAFDDVSQRLDVGQAARAVRLARGASQFVLVSIHWGLEYMQVPDGRQREIAQALADAGTSVIWGHHPHVLQPVEWVQGTVLPYPTLVAFSLGNAMFDQAGPPDTRRNAVLRLALGQGGIREVQAFGFIIDPASLTLKPANAQVRFALQEILGPAVGDVQ